MKGHWTGQMHKIYFLNGGEAICRCGNWRYVLVSVQHFWTKEDKALARKEHRLHQIACGQHKKERNKQCP